jgi:glycine/serine hydroxymethyltransferase
MKEVCSEEFHNYMKQVKKNAASLGESLKKLGHDLATDGTDTQ